MLTVVGLISFALSIGGLYVSLKSPSKEDIADYISNNDPLITLKSSPLNSRKNQQDHDFTIH